MDVINIHKFMWTNKIWQKWGKKILTCHLPHYLPSFTVCQQASGSGPAASTVSPVLLSSCSAAWAAKPQSLWLAPSLKWKFQWFVNVCFKFKPVTVQRWTYKDKRVALRKVSCVIWPVTHRIFSAKWPLSLWWILQWELNYSQLTWV